MPLYENLGFSGHPFLKTNADEEEALQEYFVPPPYFDAVIGDPRNPSASIILAPRGSGKTAQRRMVEAVSIELKFLAVTYDRFEFSGDTNVSDINLQYHLRNILIRILVSFLSYVNEYPDLVRKLSKDEKKQLSHYIQTYLGCMTGDDMQELMGELKGLPEKAREYWNKNVGFMEPVVNFLLKTYGLEEIDLPDIPQEEKKLSATYKYQLETLFGFVKKIGFHSIYILLDKPDETEQTGNDAEKTYLLVKPLLKDLELLGLKGYGFKFFLWDQVEPFFKEDARPDRVQIHRLTWTREGLKEVLSKRVSFYSSGKINSFSEVMEGGENVEDILCLLANGSPRNMIRLCEKILSIQANRDQHSPNIVYTSLDMASVEYSEQLVSEKYIPQSVRELQRVGRELFTTNYIANDVLKITSNGARNKITAWAKSGLVALVGTVVIPSSTKPTNIYCVIDPCLVRLMYRSDSLTKFLKDRWLPCSNCETDNMVDIELYPPDNNATCRNCGRELL